MRVTVRWSAELQNPAQGCQDRTGLAAHVQAAGPLPHRREGRISHGCSSHANRRATGAVRRPAPPGDLLPWSWAEQRLVAARTYWIATTRPDGRPHCRPVWGVWSPDGFWFSTGSLARHNLAASPQITVHLESGDQVVIVEGDAAAVTGADRLQGFLAAYNPKYDWDAAATDEGVTDSAGAAGPAYQVRPRVVFGWDADMRAPTRWSFADPTTSQTP
jgi:hypothetical protein